MKIVRQEVEKSFRIGKSCTGLGLFAVRDIAKGEKIVEYTGTLIPTEKTIGMKGRYLFEIDEKRTINGSTRSNTGRYVNHSCNPNTEVEDKNDRLFFIAIRRIKNGEEITVDYGEEYFDEFIKPIGCKCKKCTRKRL